MFKKLLQFKTFLIVCLLAMVGTSNVWAEETGTISFGTGKVVINAASVTGEDTKGNTWTITTAGTTSFTANAAYYQVGSSKSPATSITFTTTLTEDVDITSFSAKFGGFNGTAGTVTLKVGDTSVGTGSLNAANDVTVSSTTSAKGKVLTVTVTGISKGVKVYNISYSFNNSQKTANDLALNVTEKEFDLKDGANQTFQLTNSGDADGELSYESSNEAVATVSSTGEITAIGEGTATITVTQAESSTYNGGTAKCIVTVIDSRYTISDLTFTAKCNGSGTADDGAEWTVASDGTESDFDNNRGIHYGTGKAAVQYIQLSTSDINGTIKKIVVNAATASGVSATVAVSVAGSSFGGDPQALSTTATDYTFTGSAKGSILVTVTKQSSATGALYLKSVKVYYEPSTDPIINASNPDELAYNATNGSINYTLENRVTGGVLTATSSENWLTVGTIADNSVALSCEANSAATERVAEVTLTYTYNTNETVTKTVTVTQAANPDATMTIAEVRAQGIGTTVKTTGVVTSVNGKTAYIQDNNAAIVVFDSNSDLSCVVGDEITVEGTLSIYNGLLEITSPTVIVKSQNNTVTPEVMTIAQVNASTKQGWLVKIENATVTAIENQNTTIAQGENSIIVHGISSEVEYGVNDALTLTGNIGCFNTVQIANPTDVVVAENEKPVINVSTTTIEVQAAGTSGTIAVTYDNITEVMAEVQFFESDGITPATCDWIEAEINQDNNVEYTVAANTTTESRIAYLKVYALDDDANDVYSDLIVITQDAPVVDYASLPFDYYGNEELPRGLTQQGLGTYNSSPKMKFDNTGDYLALKLNEEPGALSYNIKGNSFSGGTFKVQTSSDGESFTDLATYTELGGDIQNEFLGSIPAGTRYIKWVYTNKSSGNVALGNIHVAKPITAKLNAYGYGTFASASAVMFSAEDENLTAWQVKGVDETEITFERVKGNVAAGTGLLLKGSEGTITVTAANEGEDISDTNKLEGITSARTVAENEYYGLSGNKFVKVNPGIVNAGKALLPVSALGSSSSVRTFTFVFVDPTTGISETQTVSAEQFGEIFNLAGQRVGQPQKGVNIINGKKVLVK